MPERVALHMQRGEFAFGNMKKFSDSGSSTSLCKLSRASPAPVWLARSPSSSVAAAATAAVSSSSAATTRGRSGGSAPACPSASATRSWPLSSVSLE
eukprot:6185099-Pleurochrysis_carterae.AAC.2